MLVRDEQVGNTRVLMERAPYTDRVASSREEALTLKANGRYCVWAVRRFGLTPRRHYADSYREAERIFLRLFRKARTRTRLRRLREAEKPQRLQPGKTELTGNRVVTLDVEIPSA